MAIAALDAGYTSQQVAGACHGGVHSWSGPESVEWETWAASYADLTNHDDVRLREVGEIGRQSAERRRLRAAKEERHEEVFGID